MQFVGYDAQLLVAEVDSVVLGDVPEQVECPAIMHASQFLWPAVTTV